MSAAASGLLRGLQQVTDSDSSGERVQDGAIVLIIGSAIALAAFLVWRLYRAWRWWRHRAAERSKVLDEIEMEFVDELDDEPLSSNECWQPAHRREERPVVCACFLRVCAPPAFQPALSCARVPFLDRSCSGSGGGSSVGCSPRAMHGGSMGTWGQLQEDEVPHDEQISATRGASRGR